MEDEWRSILPLNTIDALDEDEDKDNEGIVAKKEKKEKKLSRDMKKDSVDKSLEVIIGEPSTVFRPPYGATDDTIEKIVGEPSVLWTIDTLDWKNHDPQAVLSAVESDLHPNAIILLHDIHSSTVEGVKLVLEYLQSEGYTSVTVSEILSFQEK